MTSTDVYGIIDGQEKVVITQVQTTFCCILSNNKASSLFLGHCECPLSCRAHLIRPSLLRYMLVGMIIRHLVCADKCTAQLFTYPSRFSWSSVGSEPLDTLAEHIWNSGGPSGRNKVGPVPRPRMHVFNSTVPRITCMTLQRLFGNWHPNLMIHISLHLKSVSIFDSPPCGVDAFPQERIRVLDQNKDLSGNDA